MAKVHEQFEEYFKWRGFKKWHKDELEWRYWDGTWRYKVRFEGYAYVLYKEINIYVKPLTNLFRIYNKFKKGTAQIGLHYDVPIAHFHDPEKLKTIMEILVDKLEGE